MRVGFGVLFLSLCSAALGQRPLSGDEVAAAMYTGYDPSTKTVDCKTSGTKAGWDDCPFAKNPEGGVPGRVSFELRRQEVLGTGEDRRLFVLTTLDPYQGMNDCHSCGPATGVGIFKEEGGLWRLESASSFATTDGESGYPPDVRFMRVGPHRFGVLVDQTFTRDYEVRSSQLLVPVGAHIAQVWQSESSYREPERDNGDPSPLRTSVVHFRSLPGAPSLGLFDIEETLQRQDSGDDGVRLRTGWRRVFRFDGRRFVIASQVPLPAAPRSSR